MQYLLTTVLEISLISALPECAIFHENLSLDPVSRFQDSNLPHEPTLHVRYTSGLDISPFSGLEHLESVGDADDPADDPAPPLANTSSPMDNGRELQKETRDMGKTTGDRGMALSMSPSQVFVQDPNGKTHVLLFNPQDSIAKIWSATLQSSTFHL